MMPTKPPTTLYKFCGPDRIDIFENMSIAFSAPSGFNDTFDSDYFYDEPDESVDRAFQRIRRKATRSSYQILCLTEHDKDQKMWVHYAKEHKGFIIGFDPRHKFFGQEERQLKKVEYRQNPPRITQGQGPDISICFIKSEVWEPEREWRCVVQPKSPLPKDPKLVEIDDAAIITEVILGYKSDPQLILKILESCTKYSFRPKFFKAKPSTDTWEFTNVPFSPRSCMDCNGNGFVLQ